MQRILFPSIGPVVNQSAKHKIQSYIDKASSKLLYQGAVPSKGHFVSPHLFLVETSDEALMQEEIFGPILACIKVKTLAEALASLNNTLYGLTGALYSRHPENIAFFKREARVGNVYINRNCHRSFG